MFEIGDKVKVECSGRYLGNGTIIEILYPNYYSVLMDNGERIPYIFESYLEKVMSRSSNGLGQGSSKP